FDYDLLDDYASARLSGFLPTLLVIAILTAAAILWVSPNIAAIWAGFVLTANAGIAMLCRQFRRARAEAFNARRWTAIFISAETIKGLAWALMALLPVVAGGQDIRIIIFAMLLVGVAVNAVSTRTLPRATLVSTLPPSLAVGAMLVWSGGTLNYALAAVAMG